MAGKRLPKIHPLSPQALGREVFSAEAKLPLFERLGPHPSNVRLKASSFQVAKATSQQPRSPWLAGVPGPLKMQRRPDVYSSWPCWSRGLVVLATPIHVRQLLEAAAPFV